MSGHVNQSATVGPRPPRDKVLEALVAHRHGDKPCSYCLAFYGNIYDKIEELRHD